MFLLSEFCITDDDVPLEVADKLLRYHILPMLPVRERLGFPIWASQRSGYRPYEYEIAKGRSGNSEHCFRGKGSIDWTCHRENLEKLYNALLELPYERICLYPNNGFIHADYKPSETRLFICLDGITWKTEG